MSIFDWWKSKPQILKRHDPFLPAKGNGFLIPEPPDGNMCSGTIPPSNKDGIRWVHISMYESLEQELEQLKSKVQFD